MLNPATGRTNRTGATLTALVTTALLLVPSNHATAYRQLSPLPPDRTPAFSTALRPATSTRPGIPRNVRLVRTRTSLLGIHKWYRQVRDGHFVVGAWFARHIDKATGAVTDWDGRRRFHRVQPAVATVSATRAGSTAARAAGADSRNARAAPLMILPFGPHAPARLVWPVSTSTGAGATTAYVDAANGQILKTVVSSKKLSSRAPARVTGRGRVFDPNPVVKLHDESLTDRNDAASAVPRSAYTVVKLRRLNASHTLVGRWVRIMNRHKATSSSNRYFFTRANDKFEQVSAYHAVDAEQHYLQFLGFRDANAEPTKVQVDAFPADNSYYDSARDKISLGRGGVDDAEDPEVVWHEYGHAIQDDQVLDWGWTRQARAMGEGFGDYMAVTMSQARYTGTRVTPVACVMDWDATAYTHRRPHCLRRTDTNLSFPADLTGEPHADGRIWSRALWAMNRRLGRNLATRIIIEAQFWMNPKVTMPRAAAITVSIARKLAGYRVADTTRRAFTDRGIL
jgi:hypothetical protein